MTELHQKLLNAQSPLASEFERVTSKGLPKPKDKKLIRAALQEFSKQNSKEASAIWKNIQSNRTVKEQIKTTESYLEDANNSVAEAILELSNTVTVKPAVDLAEFCCSIIEVINKSEQDHRLNQVRDEISNKILAKENF